MLGLAKLRPVTFHKHREVKTNHDNVELGVWTPRRDPSASNRLSLEHEPIVKFRRTGNENRMLASEVSPDVTAQLKYSG